MYGKLFVKGLLALAISSQVQGHDCRDFISVVHAEAPVIIFPAPPPSLLSPQDAVNFLFTIISSETGAITGAVGNEIQSGDFNISMRYCKPANPVADRANTLQFFTHGVSYTKEYWHGQGNIQYSWADYALDQGYPTLAFDELGNGNSTRANPLFVAQQTFRAAVQREMIRRLRAGTLEPFVDRVDKLIYVGHSHGAILGNAMAVYYPEDVDALILTGFSPNFLNLAPILLTNLPLPSLLLDPTKYNTLDDLFYLKFPTPQSRRNFLYGSHAKVNYDEAVFQHDYATQDIIPLMQVITVLYGYGEAKDFNKPVFVLDGDQDTLVCNTLTGPDCGRGDTSTPASSKKFFPNAQPFDYHITPKTGHVLNLFESAQDSFKVAHDFMAQQGF